MWVALVLKRLVDRSDAPSLSRAKFKKLESEINRSFATLAHHLRLVTTNTPATIAVPSLPTYSIESFPFYWSNLDRFSTLVSRESDSAQLSPAGQSAQRRRPLKFHDRERTSYDN